MKTIVLVVVVLTSLFKPYRSCPHYCTCNEVGGKVRCFDAHLTSFPKGLPYSTKFLNVGRNRIRGITPNDVKGLRELSRLFIGENYLHSFDWGILCHLPKLRYLAMYSNKISSFIGVPNSCPNSLEILNAQNNALVSLAKEMFSGLKLKALNLSGNKIITIEDGAFANLIDLDYLDLRANRIICLGSKVFSTLYKLNHLDLSENQLKGIHPLAFYSLSALETLILRENAIEAFGYSFTSLVNIKELELSSNKIRGIYPSAFLSNRKLENLFLSLNKLSRLDRQMFLGLNNLNELT